MKKLLPFLLTLTLLTSCGSPTAETSTTSVATVDLPTQLGLNVIRFFWSEEAASTTKSKKELSILNTTTDYVQPENIFADFEALGVDSYRQLAKADVTWSIVEPKEGTWVFTGADAVIKNSPTPPVLTLFGTQYASPTPPWAKDPTDFQKTMGPEAKTYVETVVKRYGPYVKYWEIGNEMDHWRSEDPDSTLPTNAKNAETQAPIYSPEDGFSPEEQGAFFAEVSALIKANDPDAVILMPGMSGLGAGILNDWLAGVIKGGGSDWFDIVNYHYYSDWETLGKDRDALSAKLTELGINKPVWITETGSSSDSTLTLRTNYPNSESTQAADVFRRLVTAWGHGDSAAFWHTYIGSPEIPDNDWRAYGIVATDGSKKPSYYAFQLLAQNCTPFTSVELITDTSTEHVYKIITTTGDRYVAWGSGSWDTPTGMTKGTSVVPKDDGTYTWTALALDGSVTLTDIPHLLK
jgi:hypothetical protein